MRTRLPVKLKVAVLSAALTFVILCLFAVVVGTVAERRVVGGFDDDLRANVGELQDRMTLQQDNDGNVLLRDSDLDTLRAFAVGDAIVRVMNCARRSSLDERPRREARSADSGGVTDIGDLHVTSRELVVPGTQRSGVAFDLPRPVAQPVGYVQYAKPEGSVQNTVNRVRLFLGLGVLGGTLLAFLGGLLVAKRAMRPIAGLTRAAREVARTRDPDITLPKSHANDEVSDLANTFEDMLGELSAARGETEATLARQRKFVADASHELRTPLTSILANLELLEAELAGEQRDMADSALRSSRRMRRLVGDLLLLARADAGREQPRAPVDLAAVAAEAAREAAALSAEHPLSLDLPAPRDGERGCRRPSPPGRQPDRERADPHPARHARDGVGPPRRTARRARGGRPRARRAARHARPRVRALRTRRRRRGTPGQQRPGTGDRPGGHGRP